MPEEIDYEALKNNKHPYAKLPGKMRADFQTVWNGVCGQESNLQIFDGGGWSPADMFWHPRYVYRLEPEFQPEPKVKLVTRAVLKNQETKRLEFRLEGQTFAFSEREDIPGYAGTNWTGMRRGEFTMEGPRYTGPRGVRIAVVSSVLLDKFQYRPQRPRTVAFLVRVVEP